MDEIISRIINLTEEKQMNGKELGEILGLKKSPITDWKNKKAKPTLEQMIKMCEIFEVSADFILFGKGNKIDTYDLLSKDDKQIVDNILSRYKRTIEKSSTSKIG